MTKCVGCGIKLQDKDKNEVGYTPDLKNEMCEEIYPCTVLYYQER